MNESQHWCGNSKSDLGKLSWILLFFALWVGSQIFFAHLHELSLLHSPSERDSHDKLEERYPNIVVQITNFSDIYSFRNETDSTFELHENSTSITSSNFVNNTDLLSTISLSPHLEDIEILDPEMKEMKNKASSNIFQKGSFQSYEHDFYSVRTVGKMFLYTHNDSNPCMVRLFFLL